jgi:hypothetical protein
MAVEAYLRVRLRHAVHVDRVVAMHGESHGHVEAGNDVTGQLFAHGNGVRLIEAKGHGDAIVPRNLRTLPPLGLLHFVPQGAGLKQPRRRARRPERFTEDDFLSGTLAVVVPLARLLVKELEPESVCSTGNGRVVSFAVMGMEMRAGVFCHRVLPCKDVAVLAVRGWTRYCTGPIAPHICIHRIFARSRGRAKLFFGIDLGVTRQATNGLRATYHGRAEGKRHPSTRQNWRNAREKGAFWRRGCTSERL